MITKRIADVEVRPQNGVTTIWGGRLNPTEFFHRQEAFHTLTMRVTLFSSFIVNR
jgi:hypothetical protein